MGGHQSSAMLKDEWLTPPEIIKALGPFDLDPCSPVKRPWDTALEHFTIENDGLLQSWHGVVWCNPPYGRKAEAWLKKCASHGNAIALIFARTETEMFFSQVWEKAAAILFVKGRLHFYHREGVRARANSGAPSCLIAYNREMAARLINSKITGKYIDLERSDAERTILNYETHQIFRFKKEIDELKQRIKKLEEI